MTTIEVHHESPLYDGHRANRVRSMFNVEAGNVVDVRADLEFDQIPDWQIGVVVGPSGSGKTTIGRALWDGAAFYEQNARRWPKDKPIVEAIAPARGKGDARFDAVTGALAAVGLGDVPAWLRPYHVLSTGEKFRADMARIVAEAPERVVVDEFTSTVDRQIAQIGAGAFAKSWKRGGGQAVLLTCHYDVLEWLEPDWVFDTGRGEFEITRGSLQRPKITANIRASDKSVWPLFAPHHYLKDAGPMPFSKTYVLDVDGELVAHLGVSSRAYGQRPNTRVGARACRLVVMPEWQGAGLGVRFLNRICQRYWDGKGHLPACSTEFHTTHPGLVAGLRRSPNWRQMSSMLHGANRAQGQASLSKSAGEIFRGGYGGHFRAVQGFRYYG